MSTNKLYWPVVLDGARKSASPMPAVVSFEADCENCDVLADGGLCYVARVTQGEDTLTTSVASARRNVDVKSVSEADVFEQRSSPRRARFVLSSGPLNICSVKSAG